MDVQVKVRYRGLRVQPAPPEVLHPLLTTVRQMPRMTADGVLCSVPLAEPHYRIDGDSLFTHAGLLHRVVLGLEQAGHCVEVIDQRPDWLHLARRRDKLLAIPDASELVKLVADLAILDQVDATDHDLLLAVAAASRGQIVLSDPRCLLRLMAVVCRLFSQARILIPAASRAKVRHYQRQLVQLLKEPVQATFCKTWNPKCRVAVCNLASFNSPTFGNWDIVLYPGIGEAINRVNIDENLPYFDEQRLFVFVPYPAKLNARAQLRLEAACGAVIHRQATQPDARSVQVYFSCLPITSDHQHRSKTDKLTAYQRKRQLVWHNGSRNDIIAAIARAFSAGDIQQLWQHGLLLQEQEDWFAQPGRRLTVAILVEVVDHARQLLSRLPGWTIATTAPGTIEQQAARTAGWSLAHLNRSVVTSVYAEQVGLNADVIIRADGTAASWNLNCGPFSDDAGVPLTIIDMLDDMDASALQDTQLRIQNYESRGWPIAGIPARLLGLATTPITGIPAGQHPGTHTPVKHLFRHLPQAIGNTITRKRHRQNKSEPNMHYTSAGGATQEHGS